MTLFQDNNKLKARFVWWVVGWRLNGFSLRVVSGILPAMFSSDSARSGGGDIEISGSGKSTPKSQFKRASGQNHTNKKGLFNNSRTAIAGAIIGPLLVFYNSKNLSCIGALSFYDSKRSIGEVLFFNQFYWSDFWSGKWNLRKKLEWFWCWIKVKSGASGFCLYRCFWESEKLMCKKIFSKRAKFLFTCGILKQFFSFILVKRFGYDFVLILGRFG